MDRYRYLLFFLSLALVGAVSISRPYHVSSRPIPDAIRPTPGQEESRTRLILGVLEHYRSGEKKGSAVRVAFYKDNGQWKAFPTDFNTEQELSRAAQSFPESVAWTICFDGRTLGDLASKNPQSYKVYADIDVQQITSKGNVPSEGQPSTLFSGWLGGQSYRPLVLNSRPYCTDDQKWRPEKVEAGEIAAIKAYLQKTWRLSALKLSKATIKINKSYGSGVRDAKLISLDIGGVKIIPAEGEDDQNTGAWFYVKRGEVRHLGSNMLLVDIGDYDQNGEEEAVFKVQRYNNDCYTLYYDGFKHNVEFSWHYH